MLPTFPGSTIVQEILLSLVWVGATLVFFVGVCFLLLSERKPQITASTSAKDDSTTKVADKSKQNSTCEQQQQQQVQNPFYSPALCHPNEVADSVDWLESLFSFILSVQVQRTQGSGGGGGGGGSGAGGATDESVGELCGDILAAGLGRAVAKQAGISSMELLENVVNWGRQSSQHQQQQASPTTLQHLSDLSAAAAAAAAAVGGSSPSAPAEQQQQQQQLASDSDDPVSSRSGSAAARIPATGISQLVPQFVGPVKSRFRFGSSATTTATTTNPLARSFSSSQHLNQSSSQSSVPPSSSANTTMMTTPSPTIAGGIGSSSSPTLLSSNNNSVEMDVGVAAAALVLDPVIAECEITTTMRFDVRCSIRLRGDVLPLALLPNPAPNQSNNHSDVNTTTTTTTIVQRRDTSSRSGERAAVDSEHQLQLKKHAVLAAIPRDLLSIGFNLHVTRFLLAGPICATVRAHVSGAVSVSFTLSEMPQLEIEFGAMLGDADQLQIAMRGRVKHAILNGVRSALHARCVAPQEASVKLFS